MRIFTICFVFGVGMACTRTAPLPRPPPELSQRSDTMPETEFMIGAFRYAVQIPRDAQWRKDRNAVVIEGRPPMPLILTHAATGSRIYFSYYGSDATRIGEENGKMAARLEIGGAKTETLDLAKYGGRRSGFRFTRYFHGIPVLSGLIFHVRPERDNAHVILVQGRWAISQDTVMSLEMNAIMASLRIVSPDG